MAIAAHYAQQTGKRFPFIEDFVLQKDKSLDSVDEEIIIQYIRSLDSLGALKNGRWKEAEPYIVNLGVAEHYWKYYVLKNDYEPEWPEYEQVLLKDCDRGHELVRYHGSLNAALTSNINSSDYYDTSSGKIIIANSRVEQDQKIRDHLLRCASNFKNNYDAIDACIYYADNFSLKSWPELENIIIKSIIKNIQLDHNIYLRFATKYAIHILRGRWKQVEPFYLFDVNNLTYAIDYQIAVMNKQRWPDLEREILKTKDNQLIRVYKAKLQAYNFDISDIF